MNLIRALIVALILAVSVPAGALTVFDFEDGTLQGWTVLSGEAGRLPTGPGEARPGVQFGQHGSHFLGLYENPKFDEATIELRSPTFTVESDMVSFLIGGGSHPVECYIGLYKTSDNSEIYRETGRNSETMSRQYWDVSSLKGQQVYVKVVDTHKGGWGHINVDDIRELDATEIAARKAQFAGKEKRYQEWLATVEAPSKRIVYTGKALQDIAMPLGGIGGGHVSICGDGAIRQWCIFNKCNEGCVVPHSYFAIFTQTPGGSKAKFLQQSAIAELPVVRKVEFVGDYPVAELRYIDDDLPVRVSMKAFSPYIPMNARDSAIPTAVFEITIQNVSSEVVKVSLLSTCQNAAGYDGESAINGVWNKCYGGNVNEPISSDGAHGVLMSNPSLSKDARQYGTMALAALSGNAVVTPQWNTLRELWSDFSADGSIDLDQGSGPSALHQTWDAAVVVPAELRPGQSVTVPIVLAWHFPNHYVWWDGREEQPKIGRMYSNWFTDAADVANYVARNYARLKGDTFRFRDTFYRTTLPYWMLDRVSAQCSTPVSTVCMWLQDGTFAGFEGTGCCPMNCAHVWNYEQQLAHLFPELERNMRRVDLEVQQDAEGGIRHRTRLPLSLPRETGPFVDGHLGAILKSYREYRLSANREWLDGMWPHIKKAMEYVLNAWDPNKDGVIVTEQWNTYDAMMYGPNTFMGTLYLAALRASEEMARVEGDTEFATRVRSIFETGSKRLDEALWNGEYYRNIETKPKTDAVGSMTWLLEDWPPEVSNANRPYANGCHADQLLGQWWSTILDLGYVLPKDRIRTALDSTMKFNWVKDFADVIQTPRPFAGENDPGLFICTWPHGGEPANSTYYSHEVWTGIEYEVAGLMLQEGKPRNAYQIVKAASDRYNGVQRPPIQRNPWAEVECSNHYARAMSAWSMILAAQGFNYRGPDGYMEFNAVVSPENHRSFFTGAECWGLFSQSRSSSRQIDKLDVEYGTLELKTLVVHLPSDLGTTPEVRIDGTHAGFTKKLDGDSLRIDFAQPVRLTAGQSLKVGCEWSAK